MARASLTAEHACQQACAVSMQSYLQGAVKAIAGEGRGGEVRPGGVVQHVQRYAQLSEAIHKAYL
jgi:hypothetical protein